MPTPIRAACLQMTQKSGKNPHLGGVFLASTSEDSHAQKKIHHLVVTDGAQPQGIVTVSDLRGAQGPRGQDEWDGAAE